MKNPSENTSANVSTNTCGKCGFCLAVCPVYSVLLDEKASPRARIQLIKVFSEGKISSSPLLKELISKCLMCGSCTANCPSEVDHYSQFMKMRSEMIKDHAEPIEIRGLIYLLAREQRLKMAASLARVGQGILPKAFAEKYQLGNIALSKLPDLNSRTFRSQVKKETAPSGKERGTVLYFTGCATNHVFEQTGHATLKLLTHMGYRVIIPAKQACCSIPLLFHGAEKQARENILANIACFDGEGAEAIIVDCPTCGSTLKNEYSPVLERAGKRSDSAQRISRKIVDIMSFVHDRLELLSIDRNKADAAVSVTYHAPCHLKNVFTPSARVLQQIKAIQYLPAEDSQECCGGGGTFFYEYPEVAAVLAGRKINNAQKSGAELWLTDCPVCRINLAGQQRDGKHLGLCHPAEFIATLLE
ncbi:MAG: (Fe-S)-binding protein [Desulfocapsaceae bacterium]|nr:(Fe-S)-binding protein [Desulfocapsaceae bacterium]